MSDTHRRISAGIRNRSACKHPKDVFLRRKTFFFEKRQRKTLLLLKFHICLF